MNLKLYIIRTEPLKAAHMILALRPARLFRRFLIACQLPFIAFIAGAQGGDIDKANECYKNKDWGCAQDYYARALLNNSYKEGERHLIEFRIGYAQHQLGNTDLALDRYRAAIALKPDYYDPWNNAGNIFYNTKRYDSATRYYTRAIQLTDSPDRIELLQFYLAEANFQARRWAPGIAAFSQVKSRAKPYEKVDAYIGEAYFKLAKYDSGFYFIQRAYDHIKPDHPGYIGLLAVHGQLYRATSKLDSAEMIFRKVMQLNPEYWSAPWEMGLVSEGRKDELKAIEWYQKALPGYEKDTANRYILLNNIHWAAMRGKRTDQAISTLQQMLPLSKAYANDMHRLAVLQYGLAKKPAAAESSCRELIAHVRLRPDSNNYKIPRAGAHALLGRMLLDKKDTARAIPEFQEAVRLQDANLLANLSLGDIWWNRGDRTVGFTHYNKPATSTFDSLLVSKADMARLLGRRAYGNWERNPNNLVSVKLQVQDALKYDSLQKEAVQLWPRAILNDYSLNANREACMKLQLRAAQQYAADKPYVSELYNNHAVLAATKKDSATTLASLQKAISLYNRNLSAWDNLLKFYNNSAKFTEGVTEADKLIALLKNDKDQASLATAMLYKGDFLWKQGKKDAAKAVYAEAQMYAPGNKDIENRLKMQ